MNEHTGPYVDSKSRHRMSQESKEPKKKQSPERKKMMEQKPKKKRENIAQILAFIII